MKKQLTQFLGGREGGRVQIFIISIYKYIDKNVSASNYFIEDDQSWSIFSFFIKCYNTV